jgi:hypothetical protein
VTQRILNVQPSPETHIAEAERAALDLVAIPSRVVVPMIPPRMDQGSTGTCVAHMAYVLYSHAYKQKYGRFPLIGTPEIFKFYDLCLRVEGRTDPERLFGLWMTTAFRVMKGSGYPLADGSRGPHTTGFQVVGNTYAEVKRAIAQYNDPVGMACTWDANWMVCPATKVLRPPVGQDIGGHAFAAFVYDDAYRTVGEVEGNANSWGLDWGPNGTFYLRDEYMDGRWVEAYRLTGIE